MSPDTVSVFSFAQGREIARIPAGDGAQEIAIGAIPSAVLAQGGL